MREIIFRGRREYNGEWVEGSLLLWPDGSAEICYPHPDREEELLKVIVDPDTVGQYTGLKDKNGKKIFEGDVIRYRYLDDDSTPEAVVNFGTARNFEVGFYLEWEAGQPCLRQDLAFWTSERDIEVIGNIHDNPELLGGADND